MKQILCSLLIASLPLRHLSLTSPFGYRIHPVTGKYSFHAGIDLRASSDTVYAVLPGIVEAEGFHPYLGIFIRLRNGEFQIIYGHLSKLFILKGDSVGNNLALGISGATGRVTGEHLHFSVSYRGHYINPLLFLYKILKPE